MDTLRYNKCLVVLICFSALFPCFGEPLRYLFQEPHSIDKIPQDTLTIQKRFIIKSTGDTVSFPLGLASFADTVIYYDPGPMGDHIGLEPDSLYQNPGLALHAPYPDTSGKPGFVSLGNDGSLVLEFRDNVLLDGPGPDLIVFEINSQAEDVYVWISEDGIYYIPVGKTDRQKPSIDIGPYCRPGALYRYVKLRDDPSQGEKEGTAVGADIDALGAIHTALYLEYRADLFFEENSYDLKPGSEEPLFSLAKRIREVEKPEVRIRMPSSYRGTEAYHQMLSERRADTLRNHLIDLEMFENSMFRIEVLRTGNPVRPTGNLPGDTDRIEILIYSRK